MPGLHGRTAELEALRAELVAAQNGIPRLVLIEGEAGAGKSALLARFAEEVRRARIRGIRLYSVSPDEGDLYEPLLHASRIATSFARYRRHAGPRQARRGNRGLLFEWLGTIPIWGDLMGAVAETVDALSRRRSRLQSGLDEDLGLLLRAARRRVLVLLVDDVQRAEAPAAERMRMLFAAAGEGTRLLVVCACRSAAPGAPPSPAHHRLRTLGSGRMSLLRLGALDDQPFTRLVQERVPNAPDGFIAQLRQASGGNPGLAVDCLERLLHRGVLRLGESGWQVPATIPSDALDGSAGGMADLAELDDEIADLVRNATVLGETFLALTLASLLDEDELTVEDGLVAAADYGVLELVGEAEEDGELTTRYRFASPARQAALYRSLPPDRRGKLEARLSALRA